MSNTSQDPQWRRNTDNLSQRPGGGLGGGAIAAIAIGAVLALVLVAGAGWLVVSRVLGGDDTVDLRAEPVSTAVAAFTPSVGIDQSLAAPATSIGVQSVQGTSPGLYGGTLDEGSCDKDQLVGYLGANQPLADAWASVHGIAATDIPAFVQPLTPVLLRRDTAVTNYGYDNGRATPAPAVLQAGTAVLINSVGQPVVKCYCGNPLTAAPSNLTNARVVGSTWTDFRPSSYAVVNPGSTRVASFVLVEVVTGEEFTRPAGTAGGSDAAVSPEPSEVTPTPTAPATTPEPAPVAPAPPIATEESGRGGEAISLAAARLDQCQIQILGDATEFVPVLEDPDLSFGAEPTGAGAGLYRVELFVADGGVYTWTVNVDSDTVVGSDEASAGLEMECPGVFD